MFGNLVATRSIRYIAIIGPAPPLSCIYTVIVPPAYVHLFLTAPLLPSQAWVLVRAQIIADGCDAAHDPLINYLRLALTIVNTSDTKSPIAIAPPMTSLAHNFLSIAVILFWSKTFLPPTLPHQNEITNELRTLVTVTQIAINDANARRLAAHNNNPTGPTGSITLQPSYIFSP